MRLTKHELSQIKVSAAISALHEGRVPKGLFAEVAEQASRDAGQPHDATRPIIPFSLMGSRELTVAGSSGATVGTDVMDAADYLRPYSVLLQLGARVVDDLTGVLQAPGVTGSATGSWLSSESATRTPTDLTVSATLMQPKRHAALTSMSHQLRLQSLQAEGLVRQHLARLVGAAMDSGSLGGSGASGQPAGLLTVSGTQTQSGTTLNHAGVCNMLELSVTNGADDRNVAFVAVPTVRELLQTRERATGGGFAWDNNQVAGKPAYATVSMPAATAVCGDFANILIGLWNGGIELAVDPFTGFRSGVITLRAVLTMDCAILQPAAFCKTSSVT